MKNFLRSMLVCALIIFAWGGICFADDSEIKKDASAETAGSQIQEENLQDVQNNNTNQIRINNNQNQAKVGWVEQNGNTYYYEDPYHYYRNCVCRIENKLYGFDENGWLRKGKYQHKDNYYFGNLDAGAVYVNQWVADGTNKYFANLSGVLYRNTIISFGEDTYGLGEDAKLQVGYFRKSGKYYISDGTGKIKKNCWIEFNDNNYFARYDGSLYNNQIISFGNSSYIMGADCHKIVGLVNIKGEYYYADPMKEGLIKNTPGWFVVNGKSYFASPSGQLYTCRLLTFGNKAYVVGTDAYKLYGIFSLNGEHYYADPGNDGIVRVTPGWLIIGDKKYYVSPGGRFYHNQFITFGNTAYYLNSDGSIVRSQFVVDGVTVSPDSITGEINYGEYLKSKDSIPCSTCIIVDIAKQVLNYYKDNKVVLTTAIVTGRPNGHATPTGTYTILNKKNGTYLTGPGYRTWVNYWMPFIGSIYGFHDAPWRSGSSFGGNTYLNNGSHGCINMSPSAAAKLFNVVDIGTVVYVR